MGGELAVDSEPGRGSAFSFTCRCAEAARRAAPATRAGFDGRTALVVSRSPFEAPYIARRLQERGCRAHRDRDDRQTRSPPDTTAAAFRPPGRRRRRRRGGRAHAGDARPRAGVARRLVLLSPFERRAFGPPAAAGFDGYLVKPVRARSLSRGSPRAEDATRPGASRRPARPGVHARRRGMRCCWPRTTTSTPSWRRDCWSKLGASVNGPRTASRPSTASRPRATAPRRASTWC